MQSRVSSTPKEETESSVQKGWQTQRFEIKIYKHVMIREEPPCKQSQ